MHVYEIYSYAFLLDIYLEQELLDLIALHFLQKKNWMFSKITVPIFILHINI